MREKKGGKEQVIPRHARGPYTPKRQGNPENYVLIRLNIIEKRARGAVEKTIWTLTIISRQIAALRRETHRVLPGKRFPNLPKVSSRSEVGAARRLSSRNTGCFSRGSAKIREMLSSPAMDGKLPPSANTGIASTRPPKPRPSTVTMEGVLCFSRKGARGLLFAGIKKLESATPRTKKKQVATKLLITKQPKKRKKNESRKLE